MGDLNFLGADGGRLSLAFATGCVATFGFMSMVGGFIWKIIGGHRKDRITELETALAEEKKNCHDQMALLTGRITQLETIVTMHTGFQMGHGAIDPVTDISG